MAFSVLLFCCAVVAAPPQAAADTQVPGTQDTSFNSSLLGTTVYTLLPETDNSGVKLLVAGGDLTGFDALFSDGSNDINRDVAAFGNTTRIVYTTAPETVNGSNFVLVGGLFGRTATQVTNKLPGQNIIRLNPDLSLDDSFNPGAGANNYVTSILPVTGIAGVTNGIVVGGQFTQFNKIDHAHIVKLTESGAIDPSFNATVGTDDIVLSLAAQTNPNGTGPNGQILVAGLFGEIGGAKHTKLARLNADGTVDSAFTPSFDDRVVVVTTQPDGKILVGGDFQNVNGLTANHVVRLNYDGTVDTSFVASVTVAPSGLSAPPSVYVINVLDDGRIFLGGNFAQINGVRRNFLGRVNADGTLDSFDPGKILINSVQAISVQIDNKIVVGETLSQSVNGTRRPTLIRLYGDPVIPPVVTLTATSAPATQLNPGIFTFTRVQKNISLPLTVYVTRGGAPMRKVHTADGTTERNYRLTPPLSGIDSGTIFPVTFPANSSTLRVQIRPTKNLGKIPKNLGKTKTVSLTVQPDPTGNAVYTVGSSSTAAVQIIATTAVVTTGATDSGTEAE